MRSVFTGLILVSLLLGSCKKPSVGSLDGNWSQVNKGGYFESIFVDDHIYQYGVGGFLQPMEYRKTSDTSLIVYLDGMLSKDSIEWRLKWLKKDQVAVFCMVVSLEEGRAPNRLFLTALSPVKGEGEKMSDFVKDGKLQVNDVRDSEAFKKAFQGRSMSVYGH